jgi:hypothetical protein
MDGHTLLGHFAICSSMVFDGGPRGCRRRGSLPEKYLPGRFLAGVGPDVREMKGRSTSRNSKQLSGKYDRHCGIGRRRRRLDEGRLTTVLALAKVTFHSATNRKSSQARVRLPTDSRKGI